MSKGLVEDTYPLSPMQQAMLFRYRLDPKTGVYIQQMVGVLHEELNPEAFQRAWEQVLIRHTVLRTGFRWEGLDEPLQDVFSQADLPFRQEDWRNLPAATQRAEFGQFLEQDRQRGIDLTRPPLMRVALLRMGEAHWQVLWTCHHIILDGRSMYQILREGFALYEANRRGEPAQLDPPVPYRDHISRLQQMDLSRSATFWRGLLGGFTAPTPIDAVSKAIGGEAGAEGHGEQMVGITASVRSSLQRIAEEHHLTLNTFLQGAWALLLSRYAGEEDVVFGVVRAGRPRASVAAGLFINTLPMRVRVSRDQSLIPWLTDLREQQVAAREHEQTPLVEVTRCSDVPHGMPLFESDIVYEQYELNDRLRAIGSSWQNRDFHLVEESAFPLTLYGCGGTELALQISYERRRLSDFAIERMLGHLKTILEAMAASPDATLAALPILTQEERQQILVSWNDTAADYRSDQCLHEQFEVQVERTPERVALKFENETLTYLELNRRANQLAHWLRSRGVGPDVLVAVFMERSIEMVIALYAILKAGGAYVPIDPDWPAERVVRVLDDTRVPVVLTQERLATRLPADRAKIISRDSEWATISGENTENPPHNTTMENLAYVIFTSGSTGVPKGVMNSHRAISNRLCWMQDAFRLTQVDRVLQKTPFSFDVSVWEFFWPLLVGAQLVIARPGEHMDSGYLEKVIAEQDITTIHFVPSMLQAFLEDCDPGRCASLRRVICSGEALPYDVQRRFFERLNASLYNLYGPTEAAVDVSCWECRRDTPLKVVPIGRPIANTKLYILDPSLQPVPVGVAGELYIGGVQVARGYLNRPELTAERFIADPFNADPKARLYKTGDIARYLREGEIEYLGRTDFQVKIRGFRIEPGEIEAVLGLHPAVQQAVVVAREDSPGDKRLVAYVVPAAQSGVGIDTLREYLKAKVPDYMVPSAFVLLEALPLSPNGKVDRRQLPAPEIERQSVKAYIAPQRTLEKTIAGIWREILQVEKVGLDDSFFDLGGHSLLILRAHSRLIEAVGKQLSITDMFKYPTIRELTRFLGQDSPRGDQVAPQKSAHAANPRRDALQHQRERRQKK